MKIHHEDGFSQAIADHPTNPGGFEPLCRPGQTAASALFAKCLEGSDIKLTKP